MNPPPQISTTPLTQNDSVQKLKKNPLTEVPTNMLSVRTRPAAKKKQKPFVSTLYTLLFYPKKRFTTLLPQEHLLTHTRPRRAIRQKTQKKKFTLASSENILLQK